LQGLSYTSKCDVWSLGIIYYEMLFSRTPWQVKNISDLINMPKSIPVMFPANIPISLMSKNFIINCLKYDEQDRYSWKDIFLSELFMSDKLFNLSNLSPDTIQILKEL
jgi:serine/threonine protein kinase